VAVSEQEIKTSLISIHRQGFYIEPTAVASIAAIPNLLQTYPEISDWISVFTGHGLKSTEKIISIYESTHQKPH